MLRPMQLAQLRRLAAEVGALDIAIGIPYVGPPQVAVAAAVAALADGRHQYAEPAGLLELRIAIARDRARSTGIAVDPVTEVTVTCGAMEAMLVALLATTDPGDEVLIPEPFYENYPGAVRMVGAVPVAVPLALPGWRLDIAALRREVTSAYPSNHHQYAAQPDRTGVHSRGDRCGRRYSRRTRHGVCDRRDLRPLCVRQRPMVSGWSVPDGRARVIVTGGLSKTLRMTGWRIGYCVADPAMTDVLRRIHERTTVRCAHSAAVRRGDPRHGRREPRHGRSRDTKGHVGRAPAARTRVRGPAARGRLVRAGRNRRAGLPSSELSVELIQRATCWSRRERILRCSP